LFENGRNSDEYVLAGPAVGIIDKDLIGFFELTLEFPILLCGFYFLSRVRLKRWDVMLAAQNCLQNNLGIIKGVCDTLEQLVRGSDRISEIVNEDPPLNSLFFRALTGRTNTFRPTSAFGTKVVSTLFTTTTAVIEVGGILATVTKDCIGHLCLERIGGK
jgi:hypothetical protein